MSYNNWSKNMLKLKDYFKNGRQNWTPLEKLEIEEVVFG